MCCHRRRSRQWAVGLVVLSSAGTCLAEPFALSLSVQESAGVARLAEPISGGVPLPPGRFMKDQPFALYRADGKQLPCQVTPLVTHTDGTLRWVLLDFQDDVAASGTNRYVLRATKATVKAGGRIKVRQGDRGVSMDTGKINFTVAGDKPFGLFDTVTVGGRRAVVGGKLTCTQLRGRKAWNDPAKWQKHQFSAGAPETIRLWHAGPMRVTLEVTGQFAGDELKTGYQAWITAWAGSSRVYVKLKLRNSNPEQYTAVLLGPVALELRLAEPTRSVQLGAARPLKTGPGGWLHQGLYLHRTYQDIPGAARAGNGSKVLWTGNGRKDAPAGWIAATGGRTLFVCDRLFAANPSRRLTADAAALRLEPIAERFQGPKDRKFKQDRRIGEPWQSEGYWLYDCSHHSSEYLIDFDAPAAADALGRLARAARNRLWAVAPGEHYSACEAMGTGRFGTLADETACYRKWGWAFKDAQLPRQAKARPGEFVDWEDNHYESEADSVQGLLLMYLRTRQRGWLDQAEAWARYHMDLQAWRTDGWRWKDGAIWFPQGGPQGNKRVRRKWNFTWGANWGDRKASAECADLWRQARAKSCYCHYYGSGLVDWYCLTGDVDALRGAIDNVEQKDSEFRQYRKFVPGKTPVGSIRGFGRGFEVMMRVLQADPDNAFVGDLCKLCARTLWASPLMDERGFHCSRIGQMPTRNLSPGTKQWMGRNGVEIVSRGNNIESLRKGGKTWKIHAMGGTWMHVYIQNGADLYAEVLADDRSAEDMRDFATAFAQFSARYMLSPKCHQTWYYTYLDVPEFGRIYDPWAFDHTSTRHGEGCVHSGYYTRHYVDACTKGYSLTGEAALLKGAGEFWHYGSKRNYRTKKLNAGRDAVGMFAVHRPPKDDTVLAASRLFYEVSHPRRDAAPPAAVTNLRVRLLSDGKAEVSFTAPPDAGGGRVVRYQVKAAVLPIVPYQQFDYARDFGRKRNWWRAANLAGEPTPAAPGKAERFTVTGAPEAKVLHFAVRSFDDSNNRGAISNSVTVQSGP